MKHLIYSSEALETLSRLRVDPRKAQLLDRITELLEMLEANPAEQRVRARRYQPQGVWGIPVHGSGEDWLILWRDDPDEIRVPYIGSDMLR